jgi:hypothetical protein
MSEEQEIVLRKSLDAVDHIRRRIWLVGLMVVAGTLGAYAWLDHIARTSHSLEKLILWAVLALTCAIAWSTFALAVFLARMTRTILRAIHLAAESSSPVAHSPGPARQK